MADWRVRVISIAVAAGWAGAACGSRTGDYLGPGQVDGVGFGPGGIGGEGFGGSSTEVTNQAATSITTNGFSVAVTGTSGEVTSTATGGSCVPGVCQCFDCFSACTCSGSSTVNCEERCFGNDVSSISGSAIGFSVTNSAVGTGGTFGFSGVTSSVSSGGSPTGFSATASASSGGAGGATGNCCEVSSGPACDDPDVSQCVCKFDPFCCNYLWDGFCVQEVESLGCGSCETSVVTSVGGAPTTGSSLTTGEGGSGGVAECVAQSQTKCEACLCADCFQSYGDCVGDFGCPKILECIDEVGCSGLDCYTPDTCQKVIDQFGGLAGASVAYVTALVECAVTASCPCP